MLLKHKRSILLLFLSCMLLAWTAVVKTNQVKVYEAANSKSRIVNTLKEGKQIKLLNRSKVNGFYPTKISGKKLYIKSSNVIIISKSDTAEEAPKNPKKLGLFDRITYDFKVGTRLQSGGSSIEAAFGLNFFFLSWLSIREEVFYNRFDAGGQTFGLDSSLNGSYTIGESGFSFTPTIGAGYRIETEREGAPFAEGGLRLRLGNSFSVSLSAKRIFYSIVNERAEDETIFSLGGSLAGGGQF